MEVMIMSKEYVYAIYKGDKFIELGTKKELAKKMNVKPQFIGYLASPANRKRIEKNKKENSNALLTIRIDEE